MPGMRASAAVVRWLYEWEAKGSNNCWHAKQRADSDDGLLRAGSQPLGGQGDDDTGR